METARNTQHSKTSQKIYGLGMAEHEGFVWLTSHATGGVIFTGTASQLLSSADLMAGCSPRQRVELAVFAASATQ